LYFRENSTLIFFLNTLLGLIQGRKSTFITFGIFGTREILPTEDFLFGIFLFRIAADVEFWCVRKIGGSLAIYKLKSFNTIS